jgi:hypothetical protein
VQKTTGTRKPKVDGAYMLSLMKALAELRFQGLVKSRSGLMYDITAMGIPPEEFYADTGTLLLEKMVKRAKEIRAGKRA